MSLCVLYTVSKEVLIIGNKFIQINNTNKRYNQLWNIRMDDEENTFSERTRNKKIPRVVLLYPLDSHSQNYSLDKQIHPLDNFQFSLGK